jgi:peptide/nickel transport system permease protein
VIAIPLSIGFGVWMAMRRDRPVDVIGSTVSLIFAALPEFVIGINLVLLFATSVFNFLPAVSLIPPGDHAWQHINVVILPAATLILAVTPYISRIMRASMVEVLESEYVTMARLKGLPNRTVIWRHAVPNAIVPAIQVSALQLAYMAGGVVLVEFVFSYPGVGAQLVDSVGNRDVPVVQALAVIIAAVYVVVNLAADMLTILVTPRLRTAGR